MFDLSLDVETSYRCYHKFYAQILRERLQTWLRLVFFTRCCFVLTRRIEFENGRAEDFRYCVAWRIEKAAPAVELSDAICAWKDEKRKWQLLVKFSLGETRLIVWLVTVVRATIFEIASNSTILLNYGCQDSTSHGKVSRYFNNIAEESKKNFSYASKHHLPGSYCVVSLCKASKHSWRRSSNKSALGSTVTAKEGNGEAVVVDILWTVVSGFSYKQKKTKKLFKREVLIKIFFKKFIIQTSQEVRRELFKSITLSPLESFFLLKVHSKLVFINSLLA